MNDAPARMCCCWSNVTATRLLTLALWLFWIASFPVLLALNVIALVIVPFSIVWFVGLVCLTIGAIWRKGDMLLIYLIIGSIVLIFYVVISAIFLFFMGVMTSASEGEQAKDFTWAAAVFLSLLLVLQFWGLLMVGGARQEIRLENTQSAYVFKELAHAPNIVV